MFRWPLVTLALAALKAVWGVVVVLALATREPFWHQAIIVLGGSAMTAFSTVAAAWLMSRRIREPVDSVAHELQEHRVVVESGQRDPDTRTRQTDPS